MQAGTAAGTVWERRADGHRRFFSQFTIPVAGSAFSAVVAGFYLPQMADPAAATAELARALAPGGWLTVSVWDVPARARRTGLLAETIADVTGGRRAHRSLGNGAAAGQRGHRRWPAAPGPRRPPPAGPHRGTP